MSYLLWIGCGTYIIVIQLYSCILKVRMLAVNTVVIKLYPGYNWGMGNRPKRAESILIDGTNVRGHRERGGLTQDLLAAEVTRLGWHLSQGYLPSLEKKPGARVHKQLATALATALGIPVTDLIVTSPQQPKRKGGMTAGSPAAMQPRRRSGVLASPLRAEPLPESGSVKAITIGQEIDAALKEEGFLEVALEEEYDKLRESLVSHVRQLAQLYMLAKREGSDGE
jgi:hypothetical protein